MSSGFDSVRKAFTANLESGLEVGASYAVCWRGKMLVDLWGGYADKERSQPLRQDALFNLWSASKGLSAICIAWLVDRGKLSYAAPVAEYWPQFARNGKHSVTLAQLMSHQAGLCGAREAVTIQDYYAHEKLAGLLADQQPFFEPGSAWGYHALSIGTLMEELVRRVDGRTLGTLFATEIAAPLSLNAFMGLPDRHHDRQAMMVRPPGTSLASMNPPNAAAFKAAAGNPALNPEWPNAREWRVAGLCAGGASADARSVARLYDALANGGEVSNSRLVSEQTLTQATQPLISGIDQVTGQHGSYAAGFRLNTNGNMGPHPQSFGHAGWGGSLAFADPHRGLGIAYVMNQMRVGISGEADVRASKLISATYAALGDPLLKT